MSKEPQVMRIVLGSTSPRRKELLGLFGLEFDIVSPRTEEKRRPKESAEDYVKRNAEEKAEDVAAQIRGDAIVIAGDTIVALGDEILEKPRDIADATRMLERLSGQVHVVWSGVCILASEQQSRKKEVFSVATKVHIKTLSGEEIAWYIASGEPMDKAGAYGAQGIGSYMVERIEGSYSNVVGLPTAELARALADTFNLPLWRLESSG